MPDSKILRDFFERRHHKWMESIHSLHLCFCSHCRRGRKDELNDQSNKAKMSTFNEEAMSRQENEKENYVCPMHPEVKLDKSGKCPRCEMNLEQKK